MSYLYRYLYLLLEGGFLKVVGYSIVDRYVEVRYLSLNIGFIVY